MKSHWQPYREPLRSTVLRTGAIAITGGAILARFRGGLGRWPVAALLLFLPAYGGHWLELWFLNWLGPRLSGARGVQMAARFGVWFVGGAGFAVAMNVTARALADYSPRLEIAWWAGGLGFIVIELIVHLLPHLLGRAGSYNGRA